MIFLFSIQVCLEGDISKSSIMNSLSRGKRASGDLIPWTVSQQFNDHDFAGLSGGRIVRIATHPDFQGVGIVKNSLCLGFKSATLKYDVYILKLKDNFFLYMYIYKYICNLCYFVLFI